MSLDTERKIKIVYFALSDSFILIISWIIAFYVYRLFGGFRDVWTHMANPFFGNKITISIIIYILIISISRNLDDKFEKTLKISIENLSRALYVFVFLLIMILKYNNHIIFFVSFIFVLLMLIMTLTANIAVRSGILFETYKNIISPYKTNISLVAFSCVMILSGLIKVLCKNRAADLFAVLAYLLLLARIITEIIRIYNKKTEK